MFIFVFWCCIHIPLGNWSLSNPKSRSLDQKIGEMLILDDLPFSHVEDVGFRRLMNEAAPNYKLKCRKFYTNLVCDEMYERVTFDTLDTFVDSDS